jgi:predicted TIM-barrel fold metal-dependent hydrolase
MRVESKTVEAPMSARRIDVHSHIIPPFYRDAVYGSGSAPASGRYPDWSPELAIAAMDQFEIDISLMSLAQPGVQFCGPEEGEALVRRCNDYTAEVVAKNSKRLAAYAAVPMSNMDKAVEEIAYALDVLKLSGVSLFASNGEKFLGDPVFDPVMHELNERDAVVFVHPALHPTSKKLDLPWPGFMMEYLFDTTRAAVNLIFSRTIDRYPRIRFILPHAGGVMPFFAWRLSISPMLDSRLEQMPPETILAGLRRFWYDNALSPESRTIATLHDVAGPDHIVFGSDWPFNRLPAMVDAMKKHEGLPSDQRAAIDRNNALALFPQFA